MIKSHKIFIFCLLFFITDIASWPKSTARGGSRTSSHSSRSHSYHTSSYRSKGPLSPAYDFIGNILLVIFLCIFFRSCIKAINLKISVKNYKKKFHKNLLKFLSLRGDENLILVGSVTKDMLSLLSEKLPNGSVTVAEEIYDSIENNSFDIVVLLIVLDIEEQSQTQRERIFNVCVNACIDNGYLVVIERAIELDSRWKYPNIPSHLQFRGSIVFTSLNTQYQNLEKVLNEEEINSYPWRAVTLRKNNVKSSSPYTHKKTRFKIAAK